MSPTQRTHKHLRDRGFTVAKTEYFNWFSKRRLDLFGFIDTMAVHEKGIIAIQSTDDTHHAARREKILALPVAELLTRHIQVEIWSWGLRGKRGQKKLWTLRRENVGDTIRRPRRKKNKLDGQKPLALSS